MSAPAAEAQRGRGFSYSRKLSPSCVYRSFSSAPVVKSYLLGMLARTRRKSPLSTSDSPPLGRRPSIAPLEYLMLDHQVMCPISSSNSSGFNEIRPAEASNIFRMETTCWFDDRRRFGGAYRRHGTRLTSTPGFPVERYIPHRNKKQPSNFRAIRPDFGQMEKCLTPLFHAKGLV